MKISEIKIVREVYVAVPNSDTFRIIGKESHRASYIAQFGDVEVNDIGNRFYDVTQFADSRAVYTAAKTKDCEFFGCE